MGSHELWPNERLGVELQFDSQPLKVRNRPDFLMCTWCATYNWKVLGKDTILVQTSLQLEVCTQSYGPPKSWESQFREFWDSNLGVPTQNDIWVMAPWPSIENIIRGKVMASPKSRPWWILWIHVCLWLVHALKILQLRINQLVVWFL